MLEFPIFSGRDLKAWRKARGLTQTGLAALLGKTLRTIQQWETLDDLPIMLKYALAYLSTREDKLFLRLDIAGK